MTSNQHSQLERLVATCARRAWVVAYGLLRDTDEAFDAVQQAFVVALRKPDRIPAGDPWPWFGVVVAHEARNLRRKKRPTTNQELGGVMRESDPDPERAAEGTEERLRLRTAVDRLPLAEREAVTLVHLAGMTHRAAGEALGKPRQTVSVHVKSGLRRIGRELDRKPRVVAMRLSAVPVFAVPLNWETMVASWTSAGSAVVPAAGSAGSLAATTLGGIAMSTKLIWVISVSAALGLGALGGRALSQITEGDAATWESDADGRTSMRAGSAPTLWAGNDSPASQPALDATVRDLRRRLDDAVTRNRHLESRLAQADPKVGSTSGPIFTFGRAGKLPAVRDANWTEMAQASSIVGSALREISQCTARGEQAPKSVYLRLQEMVETMRKYEYRTIGKIKTEARHNGEFTHPVTIANLLGAVLVEAGAPLTQAQIRTINRLGTAFESDISEMYRHFAYGARVRRIVEEYRFKGRFVEKVRAALTTAQREAVYNPETEGLAGLDLYSPTLMIMHAAPILGGESVAEITAKLEGVLTLKLAIDESELATLRRIVESWSQRIQPLLTDPVAKTRSKNYTFDQGLVAGEATAALTERILEEVRLTDSARAALLDDFAIYVPRRFAVRGT